MRGQSVPCFSTCTTWRKHFLFKEVIFSPSFQHFDLDDRFFLHFSSHNLLRSPTEAQPPSSTGMEGLQGLLSR